VAVIVGGPIEAALGTGELQTNATEERVLRRADLAPLVVSQMDPGSEPRIVLMTEQNYNLLMPLYASERYDAMISPDAGLMSFSYGARDVIVVRRWDWDGLDDVRRVLHTLSGQLPALAIEREPTLLLIAGGWGSLLFRDVRELEESGALVDRVGVPGVDLSGRPILRMVGFVVATEALLADS
jgi:hypothetical protein